MPPSIIDIIIKATGQLAAWLTDTADIVIKATPQFASWLLDTADILLTATPDFGGLAVPMIIFGGFLVLVMGWNTIHNREMM